MWTATSSTRSPARFSRSSASTSGAPLTYGCAMIGIAFAVHRGHPARRVVERAAEADVHRLLEEPDPEAPRGRRRVAVGPVAVALREPRADGDVAVIRADEVEQPPRARRRDAGRPRPPVRRTRTRARAPRGTRRRCPREAPGSRRTRRRSRRARRRRRRWRPSSRRRSRARPRPGSSRAQLVEHARQAALLVPGGDEDDGVAVGHARSVLDGGRRRSRARDRRQCDRDRRRLQGSAPPEAGIRAAGIRFCGFPLREQE